MNRKRMIIVGGGLSGLTAGAYLLRNGHEVVLLEKASSCGGLVGSFAREGFVFDTGPRALGNAGILLPMLKDLRIDLPVVDSPVSFGIQDQIVHFDGVRNALHNFIASLGRLFPESREDIGKLEKQIRVYCSLARDLNRMPNPCFKNPLRDPGFLFREFLPRLPSFVRVLLKTGWHKRPVEEALHSLTDNPSLSDMLSQHFFKGTPASFAFGYFESFLDYKYPPGGTGQLPLALARRISAAGGRIITDREVVTVTPGDKLVRDQHGEAYPYDRLLWAADLRSLYERLDGRSLRPGVRRAVARETKKFLAFPAGESAFILFLGVDLPPEYFQRISRGHFIFTPDTRGLGELHRSGLEELKNKFKRLTRPELFQWLRAFCGRNSYEISIPVLKDGSLAPPGQTGLVISLLVDGPLFQLVDQAGWLAEFREKFQEYMIDALEDSLYPGLRKKILFAESATPLTFMKRFGTTGGAITGWSLERKAPVPDSLAGIMAAARTAIPHVYRAGQWSYSPAGVPIAILTGRIAAGAMSR
jgi:phytoene dehydrogenase-like protein